MKLPWILAMLPIAMFLSCAAAVEPEQGEVPDLQLVYIAGSTRKVCQLTGDHDRPRDVATLSRTGQRFGLIGTDLGSSLEHKGRLYFLFGDTVGRPGNRDALAWTTSVDPTRIQLEMHTDQDGKWLPLDVPGVSLGAFEVPSYGISIEDTLYVVFTTDHTKAKTMGRSVLASSRDDGRTFQNLYDLSDSRFINVALWISDPWLYIFGSGDYRRSSVGLARVRPTDFSDKSQLRFFTSVDADGQATWSEREEDSAVLFRHDVVGELSVTFCEPVGRYVMLYNSNFPRGITLRSSATPWGPWSKPIRIFRPFEDQGYGHFLHRPSRTPSDRAAFHDPNRRSEWGGEYGPYIMSRYTSGTAEQCRIYYTMSTWNPYQVVVMQSDLRLESKDRWP